MQNEPEHVMSLQLTVQEHLNQGRWYQAMCCQMEASAHLIAYHLDQTNRMYERMLRSAKGLSDQLYAMRHA